MSYATPDDLVQAFGEDELVRLTTPDGADLGAVNTGRAQLRLDEASGMMDSFLRRRYVVPVGTVGPELRRCCCSIARKLLMEGGSTQPTDQAVAGARSAVAWLQKIAEGKVTLDGVELAGPLSGARTSDRRVPFHGGGAGLVGGDRGGRGGW